MWASVTVERMEEQVTFEVWPHLAQVSTSNNINSGEGIQRAKEKGYIFPEDLRAIAYPNGIAPMCEFGNCFWQHDRRQYRDGVFCQEYEARIVSMWFTNKDSEGSMRTAAVEVLNSSRQMEHLARVAI
jgi:hypothetical protein